MKALIDFDRAPIFGIPLSDEMAGVGVHEGVLIEGPQGWGEFSPAADCDDREAGRWLTSAIEGGTVGWPDPVRGRVPVAVTVPAVVPARAHEIVANSGCRSADVTVAIGSGSTAADVARVEAVRDALGPDGAIRCDARGGWQVDDAASAITALATAAGGLEYVVLPSRTVEELGAVRRRVDVRIAVDASGALGVPLADVADVAVLACGPLGGVRRALRVAEVCGLPCVVVSRLETSVGLASGLALAGVLPDLPFDCGLGSVGLLTGDVVMAGRSLRPVDGQLPVAPSPAAPALVERFALTDAARIDWWRRRLRSARAAA